MSCPCNNISPPSSTGSESTSGPVPISKQLLKEGDTLTKLKFAYYINPAKFQMYFADIGISVDDPEIVLPELAKLADTGKDKEGIVKRPNGQPLHFSVKRVFTDLMISTCDASQNKIKLI